MKRECTELFLHYREIVRLVWNLGFWSRTELQEWDATERYDDVAARLFEGIVLLSLGYANKLKENRYLGEALEFNITVAPGATLLVDENHPEVPLHVWRSPDIELSEGGYRFRFVRFFDWQLLAHRDLTFFEVLIEQLDQKPELIGHHALVEVPKAAIWLQE